MTKKQKLALFIESRSTRLTAGMLMEYSNSNDLGVQVKTLNSNGDFVVKFSSSDPWIKPSEWLSNYKVAIKQRYEEASDVYHSLFPPEDSSITSDGSSQNDWMAKFNTLTDYLKTKFNLAWTGTHLAFPVDSVKMFEDLKDVRTDDKADWRMKMTIWNKLDGIEFETSLLEE